MRQVLDLDLPLEETPAGRFLVWLTAGLIYLAVLAFAVAVLADGRLRALDRQPQLVTVVLPAGHGGPLQEQEEASLLEALRHFPGVAHAAMVGEAEMAALVEPLVGNEPAAADLPMPRLVDVSFNPGPFPDLAALERLLLDLVPEATVVPAADNRIEAAARLGVFRIAGLAVGAAILLATVLSVAVLTRMSVGLQGETVDVLRLMGAQDSYVARQFEHHALSHGLRGALLGFFGGCLTLLAVAHLLPLLMVLPFAAPAARPVDWLLLALVPILAALLVTLSARLSAMWGLASLR